MLIRKRIALSVNEFMPKGSKIGNYRKQKVSLKMTKTQSRSQIDMSDYLTIFLFIGHHLTVNEVCH